MLGGGIFQTTAFASPKGSNNTISSADRFLLEPTRKNRTHLKQVDALFSANEHPALKWQTLKAPTCHWPWDNTCVVGFGGFSREPSSFSQPPRGHVKTPELFCVWWVFEEPLLQKQKIHQAPGLAQADSGPGHLAPP